MTSPGGHVGRASIEVTADTDGLTEEITRGTVLAAERAENSSEFQASAERVGEGFGEHAGSSAMDSFGRQIQRDANGRWREVATGRFVDMGNDIGEKTGDAIGKKTESSLTKRIRSLGSRLAPAWLQTIAVWVGLIGPPALQLAAVLAPAVGLLGALIPLAIGGAAAMGVLKASFLGVGQAIKDMNGPADTFNKDLAKLSPNARSFVLEMKKLSPVLHDLQQGLQNTFFGAIRGDLTRLGTVTLPIISRGLYSIAGGLGNIADKLARVLTTRKNAGALLTILFQFGNALHTIGDALPLFVSGLLTIGKDAVPLISDGADAFQRFAFWFDKTIQDADRTGKLQAFFKSAEEALHQIFVIGKDAWSIVSSLLDAAGKAGGGQAVIGVLTTIANVLRSLDKSGALTEVFNVINTFFAVLGKAIGPLIGPFSEFILLLGKDLATDLIALTPTLLNLVNNGIIPLLQFVSANLPTFNSWVLGVIKLVNVLTSNATVVKAVVAVLTGWFLAVKIFAAAKWIDALATSLLEKLVPALVATDVAADANPVGALVLAVEALIAGVVLLTLYLIDLNRKTDFIGKTGTALKKAGLAVWHFIQDVGDSIGTFFTKTVPGWWNGFVSWLQGLPAKVGNALEAVAKAALEALGVEIGLGLAAVLKGPGLLVEGIGKLTIAAGGAAKDLGLAIYHGFLDGVSGLVSGFEGVVGSVLGAFSAFGKQMAYAASKTAHGIADFFEGGWKTVLSDIASIPGRIGKFGDKIFNAGLSLISRFFVGLEHGADKIGSVAKGIYDDLKGYLNKAINVINSGINKVGKFFPGGLPNIPHLALGAFVTSPTIALIGERNPEVVLPTDNPARAAQLLRQSGLAAQLSMNTPNVNVLVKIGERDITDIVSTEVAAANEETAMALSHGSRG